MRWTRIIAPLVFVVGIGLASAQPTMEAAVGELHTARNDYERKVFSELSCICGCPHALNECGSECGPGMQRRHEVQMMIDAGLSHDEIIKREVAKYGVRTLRVPPNQGFNRLAWLLPLAVILLSFGGLVAVATRMRRKKAGPAPKAHAVDRPASADEENRLDDELDALD